MTSLFGSIGAVVVAISFFIFMFFICRELFCWYNKTNERLVLEKERNELLKKMVEYLQSKPQ